MKTRLAAVAALAASCSLPAAAAIIVPGDTADSDLNINNVVVASGLNRAWNIAGTRSNDAAGPRNVIFVFDVSTLPTGSGLASVTLNTTFREVWNNASLPDGFAVDAYFVGFSSTAAIDNDTPADLVYTASDAGLGTKIADDIVVKDDGTANNTTFQLGGDSSDLLDALRTRATDGTEDFAFFRLNPDVALPAGNPGFRGFAFYQADAPEVNRRPSLEYTVPEPGSLGLMSLGLLAMVRRRRS
ncbi:MAG: PEP-CTERM sorting domain-containing protein [Planctomycetota bacterium]